MHFVLDTLRAVLPAIGVYFLAMAAFLVAERILPAERNQPWRNLAFSAGATLFAMLATPLAIVLPSRFAHWAGPRIGGPLLSIDLNHLHTGIAAVDWSLFHLVLPLAPLFVFDFFYYWHHRLQHTVPALWEQHKLHHSEDEVSASLRQPRRIVGVVSRVTRRWAAA